MAQRRFWKWLSAGLQASQASRQAASKMATQVAAPEVKVKSYESGYLGKQVEAKFKDDAPKMARDGWSVTNTASQEKVSGRRVLIVTYQRPRR
jgi:hypothetical protein